MREVVAAGQQLPDAVALHKTALFEDRSPGTNLQDLL
jgi:hypothetical protein